MSPTPSPNPNPSPTMPPRHHPGEELLLAHAAGTLGAGPGLIVAVHLEACGACRALVAALEVAGGVMMAELPPVPMSSARKSWSQSFKAARSTSIAASPRLT